MERRFTVAAPRKRVLQMMVAVAASVFGLLMGAMPASALEPESGSDFGGLWSFAQGFGQVVPDLSGHGLSATLGSAPNNPTWIRPAFLGLPALHFNGNDFLTVPDAPSLDSQQVTVGAIVRAGSSPGPARYIASKGAIQCLNASYGLYTGASGGLSFYVSDGPASFTVSPDAGTGIWNGQWHRVVGTYDGSTVRLYVDGRQVGTGTPSTMTIDYGLPDGNQFAIGDYLGPCANTLGFVGDMAGVSVRQGVTQSPFG
jgi:hypothetical protein